MTENEKLKALMKDLGLKSYRDIAKITGHTYFYVKNALKPSNKIPRWVKLVLFAWENKSKNKKTKKQKNNGEI